MNESEKKRYIGYEYKEVTICSDNASFYLDGYENFGWSEDENFAVVCGPRLTTLRLKRDRKIMNKIELTRLQQHFEACTKEIQMLEKKKTSVANAAAFTVALIGTAFMAGATFTVVHEPPVIWLCILLAVPGFIGWIFPYFIHNGIARKKEQAIQPLIEKKYEEIYEICEKGHSLL